MMPGSYCLAFLASLRVLHLWIGTDDIVLTNIAGIPDKPPNVAKHILQSELAYQINTLKFVKYFLTFIYCVGCACV